MITVTDDENFQGSKRIYGLPVPNQSSEATNKYYVDNQIQTAIDSGAGSGGVGMGDVFLLMGG